MHTDNLVFCLEYSTYSASRNHLHTFEVKLLNGIRSVSLMSEGLVGCFWTCCKSSIAPKIVMISNESIKQFEIDLSDPVSIGAEEGTDCDELGRIRLVSQKSTFMRLFIDFLLTWIVIYYFTIDFSARCRGSRRIWIAAWNHMGHFQIGWWWLAGSGLDFGLARSGSCCLREESTIWRTPHRNLPNLLLKSELGFSIWTIRNSGVSALRSML